MTLLSSCLGETDLLQCAPCPPPVYTYMSFRTQALTEERLLLEEVCVIAQKCNMSGSLLRQECLGELPLLSSGCSRSCIIVIGVLVATILSVTCFVVIYFMWKKMKIRNSVSLDRNFKPSFYNGSLSVRADGKCFNENGGCNTPAAMQDQIFTTEQKIC